MPFGSMFGRPAPAPMGTPMNRPQVPMNRPPMTPMNRVSSAPAATPGIAALLNGQPMQQSPVSAMPMRQDVSSMGLGSLPMQQPQGPMYEQYMGNLPQQTPRTEDDWNKYAATVFYAPGTDMAKEKANFLAPQPPLQPPLGGPLGGTMGLGQAMGGTMGLGQAMNGTPQPAQTNMAANLSQMFNQLGQQQPAQQGGTPLQNGASPLQQSAKPVMNPGVM